RGADRETILAGATFLLYKARAYAEAHQLARTARDPAMVQMAMLTAKTTRRDATPYSAGDPVQVITEGIAHAMGVTTRVDAKTLNLQEAWSKQMRAALTPVFTTLGGADEAALDSMRSTLTAQQEEIPGVGVL